MKLLSYMARNEYGSKPLVYFIKPTSCNKWLSTLSSWYAVVITYESLLGSMINDYSNVLHRVII
jgi:hypothetical protein